MRRYSCCTACLVLQLRVVVLLFGSSRRGPALGGAKIRLEFGHVKRIGGESILEFGCGRDHPMPVASAAKLRRYQPLDIPSV